MNTYLITFIGEADTDLLKQYEAKNISTLANIKTIAICEMTDEKAREFINAEFEHVKDVERSEDLDEDDEMDQDDEQQVSYALPLMQVDEFHSRGYKGQGVNVAVMDRGCQAHEDLDIAGGYAGYPGGADYMIDSNGHGTHVAGIIGMKDNNLGWLGVAPECNLYIIKRDSNNGDSDVVAQIRGMDWAISNNIHIINCSFSGAVDTTARREAFKAAADAGIIIVTSAGNRQNGVPLEQDTMGYPSRYPFTYAVANVTQDKVKSNSSSCGSQVELSGGGQSIMSTARDTSATTSRAYESKSGTSMAAPAVAGLIALYKQMYPDLPREELMKKVQDNCERVGDKWIYGAGIPQFPKEMLDIKMNEFNQDTNTWTGIFPATKASNVTDQHGMNLQDFITSMNFIIEENENGYFLQLPNGFQVCWGSPFEQAVTEDLNGMARSESESWTFPYPFVETPDFVTASVGHAGRWADASGSGSRTSVSIRQFATATSTAEYPTSCLAIGRWK